MKRFLIGVFLVSGMMLNVAVSADEPVIIDVRTEGEYNSGHVQGSLHMPHDRIGSLIASKIQDKDAEILVYCRSGNRSGIAKKTLESLGYTAVTNGGGLKDLTGQYPVTK